MKEFGKLHLNLLSLEHVILCLLTDGGDLVKLPCHRVRFLKNINIVVNFRQRCMGDGLIQHDIFTASKQYLAKTS